MADARDKRDRGDFAGALESFKQADAIMHVPTTGYEVAKTQQQLGRLVEARDTVDAVAKLPSSPSDPAPFAEARSKAEALGRELDAKLAHLRITGASSAQVDGAPVASLDAPVRVTAGKHTVTDGTNKVDITVAPGETKDVALGGAATDPKPPPPTTEPSGKFKVPTLSLIGFGVGAAGLAVGSITGIMAISDEGEISDACPTKRCPRAREDDLDSAKTKATISTVGFVVAGIGIAVGVVGFFVQPKTEAKLGAVKFDFARMRGTF